MAIENTTGSNEFATIYSRDSLASDSCQEYDGHQARVFKIIVIGDSNVGKTCLTYRFCGGKFLNNPEATIGVDFRERTLQLDGENIKVSICSLFQRSAKSTVHYMCIFTWVSFKMDVFFTVLKSPFSSGQTPL